MTLSYRLTSSSSDSVLPICGLAHFAFSFPPTSAEVLLFTRLLRSSVELLFIHLVDHVYGIESDVSSWSSGISVDTLVSFVGC